MLSYQAHRLSVVLFGDVSGVSVSQVYDQLPTTSLKKNVRLAEQSTIPFKQDYGNYFSNEIED